MLVLLLVVPSRAFEFDIPSDAARQFGPSAQGVGQRGALLFADPETNLEVRTLEVIQIKAFLQDNAGFVGGMPVSARRRLIQPPPLKRSAGPLRAERMDWLLAGLRPRGD